MRLAELGHVDADERLLAREQPVGERLDQLGLADAGRAEEEERAERTAGVGQADAGTADAVGDELDRALLADDALVQVVLERAEALELAGSTRSPSGIPVRAATTAATSASVTTRGGAASTAIDERLAEVGEHVLLRARSRP